MLQIELLLHAKGETYIYLIYLNFKLVLLLSDSYSYQFPVTIAKIINKYFEYFTSKWIRWFIQIFAFFKSTRKLTCHISFALLSFDFFSYGFVTFEDDVNVEHLVGRKTIKMNGTKLRVRKAIRRNASQFDHISPSKSRQFLIINII